MSQIRSGAIQWKTKPVDLLGPALKVGDKAPSDWATAANDLSPVTGTSIAGTKRILLTVPSLDTGVCDTEVRAFNQRASEVPGVTIYVASLDLPFAQKRWCGAAGVANVQTISDYRHRTLGPAFGVVMPHLGLLARAAFVIGADDTVAHVEYVAEGTSEPNYDAILAAAKAL